MPSTNGTLSPEVMQESSDDRPGQTEYAAIQYDKPAATMETAMSPRDNEMNNDSCEDENIQDLNVDTTHNNNNLPENDQEERRIDETSEDGRDEQHFSSFDRDNHHFQRVADSTRLPQFDNNSSIKDTDAALPNSNCGKFLSEKCGANI